MFCKNCGTELGVDAKFCHKCGGSTEISYTNNQLTNGNSEMTFGKSISTCFAKYANFNGRASRPEYWWFYLFTLLLGWGSLIIDHTGVVSLLLDLCFTCPLLAAGSRRLHDTSRSGWWQLLMFTIIGLIPLIIWLSSQGEQTSNKYGQIEKV